MKKWVGVVGLLLSLLSVVPLLPPVELLFSLRSEPLLMWYRLMTAPLALVANTVVVICGRSMILGGIGLVTSVITCVLGTYRLLLLWVFWQNGPIYWP
jgi:hypothetical protein